MVFRNTFNGMSEEECKEEVRTVVQKELETLDLTHVDKAEEVEELIIKHFADINSVFKHMSAHTITGSTGCMNFSEFCNVCQSCGFFNSVNDRVLLSEIFNGANVEVIDERDNPGEAI